jgi:hypothetical protein
LTNTGSPSGKSSGCSYVVDGGGGAVVVAGGGGGGGAVVGGGAVLDEGAVSVGSAREAPHDAQNALSGVLGAPHCGQYVVFIDIPRPNQSFFK